MGISKAEWTILSLLLNNKLPHSRTSVLTLSGNMLPIQIGAGHDIKNIEELRELLNSLGEKGIVKVDDFQEVRSSESSSLGGGELELESLNSQNLTDLEELNLHYILGEISDEEYEKRFYGLSSKDREGFIPLTLISHYIKMVKLLLSASKLIDFKHYESILSNSRFKGFNSSIESGVYRLIQDIFNIFQEYLSEVQKVLKTNEDKLLQMMFIYLYPFLEPFINREESEKRETRIVGERVSIDGPEYWRLKKAIEVEKEIISVLKMLKEDEQKIILHQQKLYDLENKLRELEQQMEREVFVIKLPSNKINLKWVKDELTSFIEVAPPNYELIMNNFFEKVSNLLYNELSRKASQSKTSRIVVNLYELLRKPGRGGVFSEKQYLLKVSLVWINEACPAMLDPIIECDGRELTLCKNTECFVVYHRKCLEKLLRTGVNLCLICGSPIT